LQTLAREFLHNPYQVIIGSADLKANHRISQVFEFPAEHEKYHKLVRILEKVRGHRCRCRGGCGRRAGAAGVWE
jgi:superfamily II DNA/RNA helicase